jgi:hypothetical protein
MSFPKVPYKSITGRLKLAITSPTVEIVVGEEPVIDNGPDLSKDLTFKLPKGFSMSEDPVEVVAAQHKRTLKQLTALREKRETCQACKRATSAKMIDIAEETLSFVTDALMVKSITVKIKFSQEKDGSLVMYLETPERTLGLKVMTSAVEVGYFMPNGLSSEKKYRITTYEPTPHSKWLVG